MKKNWFTITNSADTATISIHDEIGYWGMTAKDFVAQLKSLEGVKNITVSLDTPGGDVNDGLTIYDAITGLKSKGAFVTIDVIGLAASMGSVIMLAGNKRRIAENGRVMIHRVTGGVHGNADDLEAGAKLVRQMEDRIISIYQEKTGKEESALRDMMKAELGSWFFGADAVAEGWADEVLEGVSAKAFKPEWAAMFTMLPAAILKDFDKSAKSMADVETPNTQENETPTVEQPAPVVETPTEEPVETPAPVEPPAPEAKGFIEKVVAAFNGAEPLRVEVANLTSQVTSLTAERDDWKAKCETLTAKAALVDQLEASLQKAEADKVTAAAKAAEIAANAGFTETKENELPPVSEPEAKTITRAELAKIPVAQHAALFRAGIKVVD